MLLKALFVLLAVLYQPIGPQRVAIINGSTSQFDTSIGPFWSGLSGGQVAFSTDQYSASFSQSCDVRVDLANAVAALDSQVDWTLYRYAVIYDGGLSCGVSQGMSDITLQTNDGTVTLGAARFGYGSSLGRHEFGHALGLGHASRFTCSPLLPGGPDSCTISIYGDNYSVMGSSGATAINAVEYERLGWWVEGNGIQTVTSSGSFYLAPASSHAGLRALKIRRAISDWLYIEPYGYMFHTLGHTGTYNPIAISSGTQLTDPASGTVVTSLGYVNGQLGIKVDYHDPDLFVPDSSAITQPISGVVVTGPVMIAGVASDNVGIYRVRLAAVTDIPGVSPHLVLDTSLYSASWSYLWDTSALQAGNYILHAIAYDMAGNKTNSPGVSVTVGTQATPTPTTTPTPTPTVGGPTPTPTPTPCHGRGCRRQRGLDKA